MSAVRPTPLFRRPVARCRSTVLRGVVTMLTAATVSGAPAAWAAPAADVGAGGSQNGVVSIEPLITFVQRVEPKVVLRPLRDESTRLSAKGNDLWAISELGSFDVPEAALRAYKNAAATMAETNPSCQLPWTLLAGIGRVESDHGRYGGSVLGSDGVPRPAIRGIALDGAGPVAAIPDSDHGLFDGDMVWDRAVGPMQFIPTTWEYAGRDGDGDGVATPNDIDDAALAAADYLCPASGSILAPGAMEAAILSYNHSDYYVALVSAFEKGYRTGSFTIPSPPPPPGDPDGLPKGSSAEDDGDGHDGKGGGRDDGKRGDKGDKGEGAADGGKGSGKGGKGGSGGQHTGPSTGPSPSPTPTPTYAERSGSLTFSGDSWLLNGVPLDLGPDSELDAPAAGDFDGDGDVESTRDELTGLEDTIVTVTVRTGTTPLLVAEISGIAV
jgi:hypothetical protein